MIQRGREKRRAAKTLPGRAVAGRRRGLWLMIGFSLIVFVVIVVFETRHEMARQSQLAVPEGTGGSETSATAEAAGAATGAPVTLLGRLKAHYRSRDLPNGWTVGRIEAPTEAAALVRIVFSPSPQDSRYGQGAPAEDVAQGSFCPEGAAFWSGLEDRQVAVELGDKGGAIKTIQCTVVNE